MAVMQSPSLHKLCEFIDLLLTYEPECQTSDWSREKRFLPLMSHTVQEDWTRWSSSDDSWIKSTESGTSQKKKKSRAEPILFGWYLMDKIMQPQKGFCIEKKISDTHLLTSFSSMQNL